MTRRRLGTSLLALPLLAALLMTGAEVSSAASTKAEADQSTAAAKPKFQLPAKCGTYWRLTNGGHNPALDLFGKDSTGSYDQWNSANLPVRAAATGTVRAARWYSGSGNTIIMSHGNGWWTAYYHLRDSATKYVKVGEKVKRRRQIGVVGNTGDNTSGTHLHFEERYYTGSGLSQQRHRVAVHFNYKKFSSSTPDTQWKKVVSHNCYAPRPTSDYCNFVVTKAHHKRSWSGTKYDSEGRLAVGAKLRASRYTKQANGHYWRRMEGYGGADRNGAWVIVSHMKYNTSNPGCKLPPP